MVAGRCLRSGCSGLLLFICLCTARTGATQGSAQGIDERAELAAISIIIDDLGYRRLDGLRRRAREKTRTRTVPKSVSLLLGQPIRK